MTFKNYPIAGSHFAEKSIKIYSVAEKSIKARFASLCEDGIAKPNSAEYWTKD